MGEQQVSRVGRTSGGSIAAGAADHMGCLPACVQVGGQTRRPTRFLLISGACTVVFQILCFNFGRLSYCLSFLYRLTAVVWLRQESVHFCTILPPFPSLLKRTINKVHAVTRPEAKASRTRWNACSGLFIWTIRLTCRTFRGLIFRCHIFKCRMSKCPIGVIMMQLVHRTPSTWKKSLYLRASSLQACNISLRRRDSCYRHRP